MQFRIKTSAANPDLDALEQAIGAIDPSVVLDVDPASGILRVSTLLGEAELLAAINRAGYPAGNEQLERVPSECCGGCGG